MKCDPFRIMRKVLSGEQAIHRPDLSINSRAKKERFGSKFRVKGKRGGFIFA